MTRHQTARYQSPFPTELRPAPARETEMHAGHASNSRPYQRETRLLRLPEVIRRTGLGKTKIYELQNAGTFPASVHVTSTAVRWIDAEVEDWLLAQARTRSMKAKSDSTHPSKTPLGSPYQAASPGISPTGFPSRARTK